MLSTPSILYIFSRASRPGCGDCRRGLRAPAECQAALAIKHVSSSASSSGSSRLSSSTRKGKADDTERVAGVSASLFALSLSGCRRSLTLSGWPHSGIGVRRRTTLHGQLVASGSRRGASLRLWSSIPSTGAWSVDGQ
jgi:hypothetical protein